MKNVVQMTIHVEGKEFQLLCDHDTSISHLKEALFQFSKIAAEIQANIQKAIDEAKKDKEPEVTESKIEGSE